MHDLNRNTNTDYLNFVRQKIAMAKFGGFEVDASEINPILKPHQRDIVKWAVRGGCRAIFAAFGLGKSVMQIETLRLIHKQSGGKVLVICPLGVRQEFKRDAAMLGVTFEFIRRPEEMVEGCDFYLTNYESVRDGKLDPNLFTAVSLDEASVLRSFGSDTYQTFLTIFKTVKYRFVATATPSPNRFKELIHYAGFLGIMDTGQALTRFFKRDSAKANNLTLYPHKEREFWLWMSSWAVFISKPSDLGYPDTGYALPPLQVHYHELPTDHSDAGHDRDGQAFLFKDTALGLSAAASEKRDSLEARVAMIQRIIYNIDSLNPRGEDYAEDAGRKERVLQRVLRQEQRGSSRKAKGEKQAELLGESGDIRSEDKSVERGQQRENGRATKKALCGKPRCNQGVQATALPEEQGSSNKSSKEIEAEEVWAYGGLLHEDGRISRPCLCDMQDQSEGCINSREAICRSLPFDWDGKRSAMPALQCVSGGIQGRHRDIEKCDSLPEQIVIWCNLNDEQKAIERMLLDCGISFVSLYGNQDPEKREVELMRWMNKDVRVFLSKTDMYGSGVNMQQAHVMIYAGIDYKFNSFIQGVHRIYRFLQDRECEVHIIYTEAERDVLKVLQEKWAQHNNMVENMTGIIRKYGLNHIQMAEELTRSIGVDRIQVDGQGWTVANNDCVIEARRQPDNHTDLIVTSIPFANHYEYTPSYNDFGHTENNDHFWAQMDFLTPELLRILKPGRIYACHVKDRILFGNVTGAGAPTVSPFHCEAIMHGRKHGFDYMGMITVVTDVVRENNQTYRLGWSEQCKDGTKMGVGSPEYIIIFRKPQTDRTRGYADEPVKKDKANYTRARWQVDAHAFWRSSGNRMITAEEMSGYGPDKLATIFTKFSLENVYDYEQHVKLGEDLELRGALPSTFMSLAPGSHHPDVWHDVNRMLTLNSDQSKRAVEQHVCPLQLDIVERLITRYSNKGELVYDPFCGLGTVPYCALKLGRRGQGSELNPGYFMDSTYYLKSMEQQVNSPKLFDFMEGDAA